FEELGTGIQALKTDRELLSQLIDTKDPLKKIEWEKMRELLEQLISRLEMIGTRNALIIELNNIAFSAAAARKNESLLPQLRTDIEQQLSEIQKFIDSKDPLTQLDLKLKENRVKIEALHRSLS